MDLQQRFKQSGMITGFEVSNLITSNRRLRGDKKGKRKITPRNPLDFETYWLEYQLLNYLDEETETYRTRSKLLTFLEKVKKYDLTSGEIIQILDTRPNNLLELYLLLTTRSREKILDQEMLELIDLSKKTYMWTDEDQIKKDKNKKRKKENAKGKKKKIEKDKEQEQENEKEMEMEIIKDEDEKN
ncbi:calcitonin gene-related peptide-receptor component protein [Anaeramoeba flamelloides]|uniref:DNA-directed RNA polymerase III subunit RPC9 n=1 Tax=Anaeramoeba flamelloides TaxID=1746091 RepID=A0AAV7YNH5_9EUKA|nr:calcitonin gene-related peptide-receptor component protein [Anaeramoeba flamelloides]